MKLFVRKEAQEQELGVDWSKPVIELYPWPFAEEALIMKEGTWYIGGGDWDKDYDWVLNPGDPFLGVATDGNYVVGRLCDFEREADRA